MEKLKLELAKIGTIEVIKNDYVFTLLLTKDKIDLDSNRIPFKVLELITKYIAEEKPKIEVMKNNKNFIRIVLKP